MTNQVSYPSSFATISTDQTFDELILLLTSIEYYHKQADVFIILDTHTYERLLTRHFNLNLHLDVLLDKYTGLNRMEMERSGIVTKFWTHKTTTMQNALHEKPDVIFLDCDIVLLAPIAIPQPGLDLGLSPQFIPSINSEQVGFFNGGFVWTSCEMLPKLWKKANDTSRYVDQASLEPLALHYGNKMFEFDEGHNIQPWRQILWNNIEVNWYNSILQSNKDFYVNFKKIKSIHTHFNDSRFNEFNEFVLGLIKVQPTEIATKYLSQIKNIRSSAL